MLKRLLKSVPGLALAVQALLAHGEIVIDRTRIIYAVATPGVTVNLRNEADDPRLVQVWIDEGDPQLVPEFSDVPFTVTPPILRLDAGKARALRVMYHPAQAPARVPPQESVYWLNVLSIRPTADTGNQVQFAFRTRIKLFLRPDALPGRAQDAVQALQWRLEHDGMQLQVRNPSAFHVSLSNVLLVVEGVEYRSEEPPMLLPHSVASIAMKGRVAPWRGSASLRITTLDDQGVRREHVLSLGSSSEDLAI